MSKSVKRLLRYGDFSIFFQHVGLPPSWIYGAHCGTPQEVIVGLCHWATFGWNSFSGFYDMKV